MSKNVLVFKYGTSRGQNTYGYTICSLFVDGKKVSSTCGGGYDMEGTCLAKYAEQLLGDKLKTLTANYGSEDNTKGYYGLSFYRFDGKGHKPVNHYNKGDQVHLNGGCGFREIERILGAFGYTLEFITDTDKETIYQLHTEIN